MSKNLQLKELILAYRDEGLSYKEISERANVTGEYARSVCSRAHRKKKQTDKTIDGICRFCGKHLTYTLGARKKEFCSDKCRSDYHNQERQHKPYVCTCEHCGKEFVSYGYSNKQFCSRECQTLSARGRKSA